MSFDNKAGGPLVPDDPLEKVQACVGMSVDSAKGALMF
jgi:hypothetical protein